MKRTCIATVMAAALALGAAGARAETNDPAKTDRKVYAELIDDIRQAHMNLARAYRTAVEEAKGNNGKATNKTRAEILAHRDEIDRKSVRLMLVADRHGWEVPEFSLEEFQARLKEEPEKPASIRDQFFPPDPMITRALAGEARGIARRVVLPVTPVAAR